MKRKYLVLTLGIAVLLGMLIGPEKIKAQLFPEPVYVVNPNDIAAGVMGTSANPMSTTGTFSGSSTPSDTFANPTTAVNTWALLGAWDASGSQWQRIRAKTDNADAQGTTGNNHLGTIAHPLIFNGTSWDRIRSAAIASATTGTGLLGTGILGQFNTVAPTFTNGQFGMLQIDAAGQLKTTGGAGDTGGVSNADAIAGTTGFPRAQAFLYGASSAGSWYRLLTARTDADNYYAGTLENALVTHSRPYGYDGAAGNWDRWYISNTVSTVEVINGPTLTTISAVARGQYQTPEDTFTTNTNPPLQQNNKGDLLISGAVYAGSNLTTNATTAVKGTGPAWAKRIIVGVAGTATTAALYDIASAGCTGTPASGLQGTFNTAALWVIDLDLRLANGLCIVTAGTTAANLTVVYK